MFSRRRVFWKRRWFLIVVIGLLCVGYLVNQSTDFLKPNEDTDKEAEVNKVVGETPSNEESVQTVTEEEESNIEKSEPYYLIKEENQVISIYYIDESGEKHLSETQI